MRCSLLGPGRLALLVSFVQSIAALRIPHVVARRSLLLGVATTLTSVKPAAGLSNEEYESIKARAKSGTLTTDNVIIRAMRDDLLDPDVFRRNNGSEDCSVLEKLIKVDMKAADEIGKANEQLLKLRAAASASRPGSLADRTKDALRESYEFGRIVEGRIRERSSMINVKLNMECQPPI